MKQLKCFLFVAALVLSFMGCRKSVEVSFENTTQEIDPQGGSIELALKSNGAWTIEPTVDWMTIEPKSGSGDATLTLTANANTTGETRIAEVKATTKDNSAVLTLTQGSITTEEYLNVTPKEIRCESEGGEFVVELSANIDWVVSAPEWIVCSLAEGSGDATITLTVKPVEDEFSADREGQVVFGNTNVSDKIHVVQTTEPDPGPGPDPGPDPDPDPNPHFLEVSPLEFSFGKEGGEQDITISCDTVWIFDLDCPWLSVSQQMGTGDATVTLTAEPNDMSETRSLEFHIKSSDLHYDLVANQAAGDIVPTVAFDADTIFVAYTGSLQQVHLTSNTDWSLQVSGWITLTAPASGSGDASFDIIVDSNTDPEGRIGFVKAMHGGQVMATLVVVQEGKTNILETDITLLEVRPEGGDYVIQVTANQEWKVASSDGWIRCDPQSGYGNGSFTISVDALTSPQPRTGYLKVMGMTEGLVMITIEQH